MTDSGDKPQKNLKKHEIFRVFIEHLFYFGCFFHGKAVFVLRDAAGRRGAFSGGGASVSSAVQTPVFGLDSIGAVLLGVTRERMEATARRLAVR